MWILPAAAHGVRSLSSPASTDKDLRVRQKCPQCLDFVIDKWSRFIRYGQNKIVFGRLAGFPPGKSGVQTHWQQTSGHAYRSGNCSHRRARETVRNVMPDVER
jgi:hypothetical protein